MKDSRWIRKEFGEAYARKLAAWKGGGGGEEYILGWSEAHSALGALLNRLEESERIASVRCPQMPPEGARYAVLTADAPAELQDLMAQFGGSVAHFSGRTGAWAAVMDLSEPAAPQLAADSGSLPLGQLIGFQQSVLAKISAKASWGKNQLRDLLESELARLTARAAEGPSDAFAKPAPGEAGKGQAGKDPANAGVPF